MVFRRCQGSINSVSSWIGLQRVLNAVSTDDWGIDPDPCFLPFRRGGQKRRARNAVMTSLVASVLVGVTSISLAISALVVRDFYVPAGRICDVWPCGY
jgi:hypothetical protein